MRFSDYLRAWLRNKAPVLERSTYEAYLTYIEKHICPYFDQLGKPLEDLRPLDIRDYVTAKSTGGRMDGKPGGLSAPSVRKHLFIIKQALRDAALYEYIPRNPAEPVRLPRSAPVSHSAQFISAERARAILAAFVGHPLRPLILTTLYYGLRRSEVLGLRWGAIDPDRGELRIEHTVVKHLTVVCKDRTKTPSSRRTFPLLPEVWQELQPLRPPAPNPKAYVFAEPNGEPPHPDRITRGFRSVLRQHDLPLIRFHDLRHATATILFDAGWSVPDVQHWLGHGDIETTMNIYAAYNSTRKLKVGGTLSEIFGAIDTKKKPSGS